MISLIASSDPHPWPDISRLSSMDEDLRGLRREFKSDMIGLGGKITRKGDEQDVGLKQLVSDKELIRAAMLISARLN